MGFGGFGDSATFDAIQVAAQGVDLVDTCATGQQGRRERLHIFQRDSGCGHQGGTAAGNQADEQVIFAQVRDEFERGFPGSQGAGVGDGVSAFYNGGRLKAEGDACLVMTRASVKVVKRDRAWVIGTAAFPNPKAKTRPEEARGWKSDSVRPPHQDRQRLKRPLKYAPRAGRANYG